MDDVHHAAGRPTGPGADHPTAVLVAPDAATAVAPDAATAVVVVVPVTTVARR